MNGYRFTITCPSCAREVVERCTRRISPTRGGAEVWCEHCLIVWRLDVCLTPLDVIRLTDDARERAGLALGPDILEVFG